MIIVGKVFVTTPDNFFGFSPVIFQQLVKLCAQIGFVKIRYLVDETFENEVFVFASLWRVGEFAERKLDIRKKNLLDGTEEQ